MNLKLCKKTTNLRVKPLNTNSLVSCSLAASPPLLSMPKHLPPFVALRKTLVSLSLCSTDTW